MLRHQNAEMLRLANDSWQRIKLNPLTAFPNDEREATKNSEKTKIFSEFFGENVGGFWQYLRRFMRIVGDCEL